MLKGWAKFMYEDKEHLVAAGDCVHQRPGIMHYLFDYSPDMEYPRSRPGRPVRHGGHGKHDPGSRPRALEEVSCVPAAYGRRVDT